LKQASAQRVILVGIFAGLLAGGAAGFFLGEAAEGLFGWLGDLFLRALKMIIVPLIVASMVTGVTSLGDARKLGRTGFWTLAYYMATTALSVAVGIVLVNLIRPGVGVERAGEVPAILAGKESLSFTDVILGMVPDNLFTAAADLDILPLIVFSLLFGGVVTTLGERGRPLTAFFDALNEAMMRIVHLVMWFAPVGVFGLVAGKLGEAGGGEAFLAEIAKVGKYMATVLIGLGVHGLVVLPLILWLFTRRNPWVYFRNMLSALTTAWSTASSSATLPVTFECVEEQNEVASESADLVLPLGATINMDGTALYEAVAAIFIAQSYGVPLGFQAQCIIFVTATLAAVGAAGVPQAGLVTMVMVLQAVHLPLEGIGIILAVDWFLDRWRTAVNVWGDSIGAAVVERVIGVSKKD